MEIVIFAGGLAGRETIGRFTSTHPDAVKAIVWNGPDSSRPDITNVLFETFEEAVGRGDALLCSGYGQIVSNTTLESFTGGAFKAHPSLLPAYRGRHAIQWAIAEGEREFGVTIHRMTDIIETGEIMLSRS